MKRSCDAPEGDFYIAVPGETRGEPSSGKIVLDCHYLETVGYQRTPPAARKHLKGTLTNERARPRGHREILRGATLRRGAL